ncbi:MAG: imidazole glycerol phosphate synthase subunit HisF [Acidobacteriota bacterium]|nr:imidazole glycerol phosphate synthase subunit HisF [Acidobacteriota bacterium]
MLTRRIIPCLDVRAGRVVKGVRFAALRDAGDPARLAAAYAAQGADEVVLLDVAATLEERRARLDTVRRVREVLDLPLTVGGGVRSEADAAALLEAGADRVSVNSAAVADPALIERLAARFGSQCTVLAIDARRREQRWEVLTHAGRRTALPDAADWARRSALRGAGEILLTAWDRDGTGSGYELELIAAVRRAVPVPVIASGGGDGPGHMLAALEAGADAVLAASIFHDGRWTVGALKSELARRGVELRPC